MSIRSNALFILMKASFLFLLTLNAYSQNATSAPTQTKQKISTTTLSSGVISSIETSLVIIEDASGKNYLGYCFDNGYSGKSPNSSWILSTSIESKEDIYIKYRGIKIKAELKYTDTESDVSILFVDNTVIKKINTDPVLEPIFTKGEVLYASSLSNNKIAFRAVDFERKLKLSGVDFIEVTSKSRMENLSGVLINASGDLIGLPTRKFNSSDKTLLVTSTNNIRQIHKALFSAEIIKLIAIDEKYRHQLGDDFVKWLYKGDGQSDDKNLKKVIEAEKIFLASTDPLEAFKKHQASLYDIAIVFLNSKNTNLNTQKNSQKNINLICQLNFSIQNRPPVSITYAVDLNAETVNGYKANITENQITFSYIGGNTTYNARVDRVAGHVVVGSRDFPMLASGPCTKSEGRAF